MNSGSGNVPRLQLKFRSDCYFSEKCLKWFRGPGAYKKLISIWSGCAVFYQLQALFRGHNKYFYYKSLQRAALITQCGWRRRVARKELRNLKMVLTLSLIMFHLQGNICIMWLNNHTCIDPGCKRNRCPQRSKRQARKESRRTYMALAVWEAIEGKFWKLCLIHGT